MGKNGNSVVVLRIWLKFWCMIPMGVKYNHTKLSEKLNGGGRERDSQVADLGFKNCNLGPRTAIFWAKKALEPIQNGQPKGNGWYTPRAA